MLLLANSKAVRLQQYCCEVTTVRLQYIAIPIGLVTLCRGYSNSRFPTVCTDVMLQEHITPTMSKGYRDNVSMFQAHEVATSKQQWQKVTAKLVVF